MKRLLTGVLAATSLAVAAAVPAAAQDGPRIAYINSQRIVAQAPGAQEARQALEKDMAGYQSELQQLEEELKALMAEYEQKQVMLSPEARRQRQQEITQKQQQYQQRAAQLQEQAAERQSELVEPIMRRIDAVIAEIREERGYAMVFDVASGGVVAADPALDITDEVLTRLRATASN